MFWFVYAKNSDWHPASSQLSCFCHSVSSSVHFLLTSWLFLLDFQYRNASGWPTPCVASHVWPGVWLKRDFRHALPWNSNWRIPLNEIDVFIWIKYSSESIKKLLVDLETEYTIFQDKHDTLCTEFDAPSSSTEAETVHRIGQKDSYISDCMFAGEVIWKRSVLHITRHAAIGGNSRSTWNLTVL